MFKLFKKLRILAILLVFNTVNIQAVEIKSDVDAILALGGQMSNVRKMLETYTLVGADFSFLKPEKKLKASIVEYESVLSDIEKKFKDPVIQESIKRGKIAWKPVHEALDTAFENTDKAKMKEQALFIHANIRSVIIELAKMKKYIIEKSKVKDSDKLNAVIEIGASARRLSAHYMMRMWELPDPTIEDHWQKGVKIYSDSLSLLKESSYAKNPKFKRHLAKCEKELNYFKMVWGFHKNFTVIVQKKGREVFDISGKIGKIILSEISK